MLNSLPVNLAVGTILGFLTGLGIGGGSLLILWLTMVLGMEPYTARSINLMFFIPSAVIACVFRLRQNKLSIQKVFPAIISGCITAAVCAWFSTGADLPLLQKAFGLLLLAAGIRELLYTEKRAE